MAETCAAMRRAWELSYLDPARAGEIARAHTPGTGACGAEAWLLLALCEVRVGDADFANTALENARRAFAGLADTPDTARRLRMCDEVRAIALRRSGDLAAAARLQDVLDARHGECADAMDRFVAQNSRAITAKQQGRVDQALRHFHAAHDAAQRTGWCGPRITALCNLGGYHQDLFNLEDARSLSEEALQAAQEAGAMQALFVTAGNLVVIYHALGEMQQAKRMATLLQTMPAEGLPGVGRRLGLPVALGHLAVGDIDAALRQLAEAAPATANDGDGMSFWAWLMARCLLARGEPQRAREIAEATQRDRQQRGLHDGPYDSMALHRALADAAEQAGDPVAALRYMRQAHALYEELVGRSARARFIALEVSHQLVEAQRERDLAVDGRRSAEDNHRKVAELNAALQLQVAQTEALHAQLKEQAVRDPLTGLHNRRYLFERGPGMLELARRQDRPLCVVLLDLDHFKLLNDTCGHAAGDLVLQRFAALLAESLRKSDLVCRHGGEEFVAVMPDIDPEDAQEVLARLLDAFSEQQFELGRRRLPRGTFSAGIATLGRHGHTLEQLLSRADRALYAAKHQGRARIELVPRTGFATLS